MPLHGYRYYSFYTMRTDVRDRFGTQVEKRFTRSEITVMRERSGLDNIIISDSEPFWCAVGTNADACSDPNRVFGQRSSIREQYENPRRSRHP